MQCSTYRAAISARLDGEDIGLPAEVLDAHLAGCSDCRAWSAAADALAGAVARAPRPDVSLDPALLAALVSPAERRPARAGLLSTGEWRVSLGVIAVALLVVAWPGAVLQQEGHASVHIAHQLTAWDVGLAAGFLVAALFPARAWGMFPLACVLVACMTGAFVVDLLAGHGVLGTQFVHALEIAGLVCLWALGRRSAHQPGEVRLA
jgi:predicted anti-sigma-YlaC factor YlaD